MNLKTEIGRKQAIHEIERLIQIFEQLLPIYEKAYKEKWEYFELINNHLHHGICRAAIKRKISNTYLELEDLFFFGYYKHFTNKEGYIYKTPDNWQDLKPRIDFMRSEIKDLKRLLKQGYTHV